MIDDIINFYRIGRILGLKPNEINGVLSYKSHNLKSNILFSIFIAAILIYLIILFVFIGSLFIKPPITPNPPEHTYTPGTFYSTVKLRDFKKKQ